jgi:hypothetical protein
MSATTLSIMTFSITTLSTSDTQHKWHSEQVTLSTSDTQHRWHSAQVTLGTSDTRHKWHSAQVTLGTSDTRHKWHSAQVTLGTSDTRHKWHSAQVTLSPSDTQHKNDSLPIFVVSLFWVWRFSLLFWTSLCWVSSCRMSWHQKMLLNGAERLGRHILIVSCWLSAYNHFPNLSEFKFFPIKVQSYKTGLPCNFQYKGNWSRPVVLAQW